MDGYIEGIQGHMVLHCSRNNVQFRVQVPLQLTFQHFSLGDGTFKGSEDDGCLLRDRR